MNDDDTREPWLDEVVRRLREEPGSDPRAQARVMERIRAQAGSGAGSGRPRRPSLLDWLLRPRPVAVSPLALGAAGLGLVLLAFAGGLVLRRPVIALPSSPGLPSATVSSEVHPALFTVLQPRAARVSIVGDFNNWDPAANPLQKEVEGIWAGVVMLPSGVYSYAYAVDGRIEVIADTRPAVEADDFGVGHSVLVVGKETI